MREENLKFILEYLGENVKEKGFSLKTEKNIFFNLLKENWNNFKDFKQTIRMRWEKFKQENQIKIINRNYTSFLFKNFNELFLRFISQFFGLDGKNKIKLLEKDLISNTELFFEYNYNFSKSEIKLFNDLTKKYNSYSNELLTPIAYFFFIIAILGIIIRKEINQQLKITLEGAVLQPENSHHKLHFLIFVKNSRDELYNNYYDMVSYYFLNQFKNDSELKYQESPHKLYDLALQKYDFKKTKSNLIDLLYYFYKKCRILQNFCPILDFFNFICSRVEDSVFSKLDIIKNNFLDNFDYSAERKNALIRIFDFLDRRSTLSSTFLANNLPTPKAQINLFLLIKKYYLGSGLESLEVGDTLFHSKIFRETLDEYNESAENRITSKNLNEIDEFLNYFSIVGSGEINNIIFKKIFTKQIKDINYEFFKSFFKSLNKKLFLIIEEENQKLTKNEENLTFDFVISQICRMLYVLIEKIFLRNTPNEASKNFLDPQGRYIGRNIALRVMELFIFQDMNFSDDIWPDFILSYNKDNINNTMKKLHIEIPEKYFYDVKELTRFLITYNFQSFSDDPYLEEWLIYDLIVPLNNFIMKIKSSKEENQRIDAIHKGLFKYFSQDITEKHMQEQIMAISEKLAIFWENLK